MAFPHQVLVSSQKDLILYLSFTGSHLQLWHLGLALLQDPFLI